MTASENAAFFRNLQYQHQESVAGHVRANLVRFFDHYHCPQINYDLIGQYIAVADKYQLPYTLLPSISLQESTCFEHYRLNNAWGWASARTGFQSPGDGIEFISNQLANGKYYAGKTIEQKLVSYNSLQYAKRVEQIMQEIETQR